MLREEGRDLGGRVGLPSLAQLLILTAGGGPPVAPTTHAHLPLCPWAGARQAQMHFRETKDIILEKVA